MRIGFDLTPLCTSMSGVGTYTISLLQHLQQLALHDIVGVAHRSLHPVDPADDEAISGITQLTPHIGLRAGLNKTLWMQMILPGELSRLRADLCHFTNSVASLRAPCPTVVTIHDMTLWLFPSHHYLRRLLAMRPFIPVAARRAAAIIAVSHATKADIVRILRVDERKVHVVHEAPSPHFHPWGAAEELERVSRAYGLPPRLILYVGSIEPRKNLVRLLEAYAKLREHRGLDHALVFVGGAGWKGERVLKAVEELKLRDAVRFLGYVPKRDLVAFYNLADVLAYPSLYEGFGLPVLEAMACGTPVLTSRRGSLAEVAGSAAEFVDPLDSESIAAGLWRVLTDSDRREEQQVLGIERAARFSWDSAARETSRIYSEVARGENHDDLQG